MAKIRQSQPLVPSVLDRLMDDEPEVTRETAKSRTQVLRELRLCVQRDLENLLNTRWRCDSWPAGLPELEHSLVNYGIPDFSGASVSSSNDRQRLRRIIERAIELFEPRFQSFRVEMVDNEDPSDRTIRFRIDAMLFAHPAPEPVVFDSQLESTSQQFEVRQAR